MSVEHTDLSCVKQEHDDTYIKQEPEEVCLEDIKQEPEVCIENIMQKPEENCIKDIKQEPEEACVKNIMQEQEEVFIKDIMQEPEEVFLKNITQERGEVCVKDIKQEPELVCIEDIKREPEVVCIEDVEQKQENKDAIEVNSKSNRRQILVNFGLGRKKVFILDEQNSIEDQFKAYVSYDPAYSHLLKECFLVFQEFNSKFAAWVDIDKEENLNDGTEVRVVFFPKEIEVDDKYPGSIKRKRGECDDMMDLDLYDECDDENRISTSTAKVSAHSEVAVNVEPVVRPETSDSCENNELHAVSRETAQLSSEQSAQCTQVKRNLHKRVADSVVHDLAGGSKNAHSDVENVTRVPRISLSHRSQVESTTDVQQIPRTNFSYQSTLSHQSHSLPFPFPSHMGVGSTRDFVLSNSYTNPTNPYIMHHNPSHTPCRPCMRRLADQLPSSEMTSACSYLQCFSHQSQPPFFLGYDTPPPSMEYAQQEHHHSRFKQRIENPSKRQGVTHQNLRVIEIVPSLQHCKKKTKEKNSLAPPDSTDNTANETTDSVATEVSGDTCHETTDSVATEVSGDTCHETTDSVATEVSGNTCHETTDSVATEVSGDTCLETTDSVGTEVSRDTCHVSTTKKKGIGRIVQKSRKRNSRFENPVTVSSISVTATRLVAGKIVVTCKPSVASNSRSQASTGNSDLGNHSVALKQKTPGTTKSVTSTTNLVAAKKSAASIPQVASSSSTVTTVISVAEKCTGISGPKATGSSTSPTLMENSGTKTQTLTFEPKVLSFADWHKKHNVKHSLKIRNQRLQWGKDVVHRTKSWKGFMFSDVSTFVLREFRIKRVSPNESTADLSQSKIQKFWGCLSFQGPVAIVPIGKSFECEVLSAILRDKVVPFAKEHFANIIAKLQYFMCFSTQYKRSVIAEILRKNSMDLEQWPNSVNDLNPLEHVWDLIAEKAKNIACLSESDMIAIISTIWEKDEDVKSMCKQFVLSIQSVINDMIGHGGRSPQMTITWD